MRKSISAHVERWPVDGEFIISRGSKHYVDVVVCEISENGHIGRGEATPIYYRGENAENCAATINLFAKTVTDINRNSLQTDMPEGAARNAVDCALWDLETKLTDRTLESIAGLPAPRPLTTAFTISLNDPAKMEADAKLASRTYPLLKLKLAGEDDHERVAAVHRGAPDARLIVDANESWNNLDIAAEAETLSQWGVELIEQPVSAGRDELLTDIDSPVPFCADESCHISKDVARIAPYYDAINIKLDKSGGLTEALKLVDLAEKFELKIMVGCMLSTSLAIRPAFALALRANWVDLDGPLLLEQDRIDGFHFENGIIMPRDSV